MPWLPPPIGVLTDVGDVTHASPAQGDMLYWDGSGWVKVGGTLTTDYAPVRQSDGSIQWAEVSAGGGGGGGGADGGYLNFALFRPYTVSPSPHSSYADTDDPAAFYQGDSDWTLIGGGLLTDGKRGSMGADEPSAYTDGYLGWNNVDPVIRVDLGSAKEATIVRIFGATDEGVGIYLPTAVKLEYSDDDSAWTEVEDRTSLTGTASDADEAEWFMEFSFSSVGSHRYWRISLTKYSTNNWIFVGEVEILGLSGSGSAATPEWISALNERQADETPHDDDDFFDDATLSGTAVTPTGTATWTEKRDLLSVLATSVSSGDAACRLWALTPTSAPVTIETRVKWGVVENNTIGLCFTDGTTATDEIAACAIEYFGDYNLYFKELAGTITSFNSGVNNNADILRRSSDVIYMRCVWTAANTFENSWSLDGVSWHDFGAGSFSRTMTPTHFGLFVCTNGDADPILASFDYIRVNESDLSP